MPPPDIPSNRTAVTPHKPAWRSRLQDSPSFTGIVLVAWCAGWYGAVCYFSALPDPAFYLATELNIVGVVAALQSIVYRSALAAYNERKDTTRVLRTRWLTLDLKLLGQSLMAMWLCLTAAIVALLLLSTVDIPYTPKEDYLVWHIGILLGATLCILLVLCSTTDYLHPRLVNRASARRTLAKPFAAQAASFATIGLGMYLVLVYGAALELKEIGASMAPWMLTGLHIVVMAALLMAGSFMSGWQGQAPGRRTLRPSSPFFIVPPALVAANMVLAFWAMPEANEFKSAVPPAREEARVAEQGAPQQQPGSPQEQQTSSKPAKLGYRWAPVGWCLSVLPLLIGLPFLRVRMLENPRPRLHPEPRTAPLSVRLERVHVDIIRAKLVLFAILERHLSAFAISLPISLLMCVATVVTPIDGSLASPFQMATFFLVLTIAWTGPFFYSLTFIEETFEFAYSTQLRRTIQRMRGHILVLGYGDVGRRYVRELLQSNVVAYDTTYEHLAFAWNILLPNGDLAKVLTRIAAVEIDALQIDGVVRPPGHAPIGRMSLTRTVQHIAFPRKSEADPSPQPMVEFVIPVVNGDAASEEVQNLARLPYAAFVTSLMRPAGGTDRQQAVFQRLSGLADRGSYVPAALALRSSTHPPYLLERIISRRLPIHYILPAHLEGLNAANLLYAFYRRARSGDSLPKILICGRGKRMFYLIDSFVKALPPTEYKTFAETSRVDPVLVIMTTDRDFVTTSVKLGSRKPGLFHKWGALDALVAQGQLHVLSVTRHVSRNPAGSDGQPAFDDAEIPIPLLDLDSRDHANTFGVLRQVGPSAVLVSDDEADDEFRIINAVVTNSSRLASTRPDRPAPLVMVTGETGRAYLETNFQNAMTYHESVFRGVSLRDDLTPTPPYPDSRMERVDDDSLKLAGDSLIDVLEDPVERLVGLTAAYLRPSSDTVPVELNFCVPDTPGALASTLAGLAGCVEESPAQRPPARPRLDASFTNTRFVAMRDNVFAIRSFMVLDGGQPIEKGFARVAITAGQTGSKNDDVHRDVLRESVVPLALSWQRDAESKHRSDGLLAPLTYVAKAAKAERDFKSGGRPASVPVPTAEELETVGRRYIDQASGCCGMPTCPVEAFNKIALPIMSDKNRRSLQRVDDVARCFVPNFLPKEWEGLPEHEARGPLAYIRVECDLTRKPGSFATALNALLMRKLVPQDPEPANVFDFTYLSSYECHDARFGVFSCYGRRVGSRLSLDERGLGLCVASVIRQVEIRPITDRKRWFDYTNQLLDFLSEKAVNLKEEEVTKYRKEPLTGDDDAGWRIVRVPSLVLKQPSGKNQLTWSMTNTTGDPVIMWSHRRVGNSLVYDRLFLKVDGHEMSCGSASAGESTGYVLDPGHLFEHTLDLGELLARARVTLSPGRHLVRATYHVAPHERSVDVCRWSPGVKDKKPMDSDIRTRSERFWHGKLNAEIEFNYE